MNKHDHHSPRPYKGHGYRILVDGFEVASFNTLARLSLQQRESAKNAYSVRLKIPSQRLVVEAA